jgi:hypothetical protein
MVIDGVIGKEEKKEVRSMLQVKHNEWHTSYFPLTIKHIIEKQDNDLSIDDLKKEMEEPSGKEAILAVLAKAADDHKFLAHLSENTLQALSEYNLTLEEKAALGSGDIRRIESWVGKLGKRLSIWITCRLQQEKW